MKKEQTMAEFFEKILAEARAKGWPHTPSVRARMIANGTIKVLYPDWPRPQLRVIRGGKK